MRQWQETCRECGGDGELNRRMCRACRGKGRVTRRTLFDFFAPPWTDPEPDEWARREINFRVYGFIAAMVIGLLAFYFWR